MTDKKPAVAAAREWPASGLCLRGEHGWCMNRTPAESHCSCDCHVEKARKEHERIHAACATRAAELDEYTKVLRELTDLQGKFAEPNMRLGEAVGLLEEFMGVYGELHALHDLGECDVTVKARAFLAKKAEEKP